MKKIDLNMPAGAVLSRCQTYRYALWRTWDAKLPKVLFICLNPSVADHQTDDPTLRRCMGFAKSWGYGGSITANLFAYRATDPTELTGASDPVGRENNRWLKYLSDKSDIRVAAWGNDGALQNRSSTVRKMIPSLHYLKMNQSGEPAHPLYLRRNLVPIAMEGTAPPSPPQMPQNVARCFDQYPATVRKQMLSLRTMIYQVAADDSEIGTIEETLKWGQPSYLTVKPKSGTTIRIDWSEAQPHELTMFVHCQTSLIDCYRCLFPDVFRYDGNRAVRIDRHQLAKSSAAADVMAQCISMALRYHVDKNR